MADYDYAEIRAGFVAALASLNLQSRGYVLAAPMADHIECSPGGVVYDETFGRGHDALTWRIRITTGVSIDEAAQKRLDVYLAPTGASSVKTLIEADTTLGGVVKDLQVTEATGYELTELVGGGTALSCTWTVMVDA